MNDPSLLSPARISAECFCLNIARVSRAVTRRYDAAFRSIGLTSGQFAVLAALNQPDSVSIGTLAEALGLERTTLTRNLAPLHTAGLVRTDMDGNDKRVRRVELTDAGRTRLGLAMVAWRSAQQDSDTLLAGAEWPPLRAALDRLKTD